MHRFEFRTRQALEKHEPLDSFPLPGRRQRPAQVALELILELGHVIGTYITGGRYQAISVIKQGTYRMKE